MPLDGAPREEFLPTYSGSSLLTAGADDYPSVLPAIEVAISDFGPPPHGQLKIDALNRQSGIGER